VLAIVLSLAAAIGYGSGDFAAGIASRTASVIRITLLATMAGVVVTAAALPLSAAHRPGAAALSWGAVAGLGGTIGGLALYMGFRHAAFSVAGPISAVGAAGFSVLAGLLLGERPSALALTGIILALPAIVGVSASRANRNSGSGDAEGGGRGRHGAGVIAGLVAGACFAVLFVGLNRAGDSSGLWPVVTAEVAEFVVAAAVAVATGNVRLPGKRPSWLALGAGVVGSSSTIAYYFATHDGFLAVTAVLTSLYPATTIVLARTVLGERLTRLRLAGLSLAAVCVALIAAGGAG
jgi:drug/metabolite transporter (DMT)-like permease